MMILKNPDKGAPITHIVDHKEYQLAKGQTLAFDEGVGRVLKEIYGFLEEIVFEQQDDQRFKCPLCSFTHEKQIAVMGHMGVHGDRKAPVQKVSSQEAVPSAEGKPIVSLEEQRKKEEEEEFAVLAGQHTDKDGYTWYGDGLAKDNPASGE